jgi:ribose transport system permease protein
VSLSSETDMNKMTSRGQLAPVRTTETRARWRPSFGFNRFSGIYLTAAFIVIFGLWEPDTFLTTTTAKNILSEQSITAVLMVGVLIPLVAGAFDLSAASMLGFSSMICAWLTVEHQLSTALTVLIAIGVGVLVGMVTGAVVVFGGVDSFVATLGMGSVLLALTEYISGGQYISGVPGSFTTLTDHSPLGIPLSAIIAVVIAIVAWWALEHTSMGRRLFAVGSGREAARLAGVPTRALTFWSLVASATIASLAGVMFAAKLASANPQGGAGYLLPAYAAVLLGVTQILPGRVNVWGAMLAVLLLAVGAKGLQLASGELWVSDLFSGLALIIAVTLAALGQRGPLTARIRGRVRS